MPNALRSGVFSRPNDVTRSPRGIPLAALRVPLLLKLAGALALVVLLLVAGWAADLATVHSLWVATAWAAVVFGIGIALIVVALRPIRDLESTVTRVWRGDFGARVSPSMVADNEVLRVGAMFNVLLDGLSADRARMRALAAQVIEAGDRERAALARELHDSTAQRLAALLFNISVAARDCHDPELAKRLATVRDAAEELTNEVRSLAQSVHPRVLDDLGLVPALRKLARDASNGSGIDIDVSATDASSLPLDRATVLYRVAQEAVRNAVRHGDPKHVRLTMTADDATARLEVLDDGRGFDASAVQRNGRGTGLSSMRDRLAVVEGTLDVRTAPGGGTAIVATIPVSDVAMSIQGER